MATNNIKSLTAEQKSNIKIIVDKLKAKGLTNPFTQAGILAIVSKESNYKPNASEISYQNTDNKSIRKIFSKTRNLTDAQLNNLKANKVAFFNFVYNGIIGNGPNDGYLFRGRGYNQLTGRANYANISKLIGIDLIKNPDLLSTPSIAADALIAYMADRVKRIYPNVKLNDFKNATDSLNTFYDANAGSPGKHLKDVTGGYAKAKSVVDELYTVVKENKTATGGGLFFLILTGVAIWKRKEIKNIFTKKTT